MAKKKKKKTTGKRVSKKKTAKKKTAKKKTAKKKSSRRRAPKKKAAPAPKRGSAALDKIAERHGAKADDLKEARELRERAWGILAGMVTSAFELAAARAPALVRKPNGAELLAAQALDELAKQR